jgi:hypothetical protein
MVDAVGIVTGPIVCHDMARGCAGRLRQLSLRLRDCTPGEPSAAEQPPKSVQPRGVGLVPKL